MDTHHAPHDPSAAVLRRPAHAKDIPEMADVFLASAGDMFTRNGVSAPLPPRQVVEWSYGHVLHTGMFRVAESKGRIMALAGAVIRDRRWYLSSFWALPGQQRQKVGMPLLRELWAEGQTAGATTFFTWSSVDTTAMAAYMKMGMLPGYPILLFEGAPFYLPAAPEGASEPLALGIAEEMDLAVLGTRREADHALWRNGIQGRQVIRGGEVVGYYYINRGTIGPVAWNAPDVAETTLAVACRDAAEQFPSVRLAVPGINHAAVRFAYKAGLRLNSYAHLLASGPIGSIERYVPSGPSLF